MTPQPAGVHFSVSTWQQLVPADTSPARSAVVTQVVEKITSTSPRRLRIAIDGLTASGKTTFGHELAQHIAGAGRPVLRACLDDFKRPWCERHLYDRESGEGYYRNAFDCERMHKLLLDPCAPGASGQCALCSIDPLTQIDHSDVLTAAPADAVLIVDGVFAFRPEIDACWDFRIWLEVAEEISVRRGELRDVGWGAEAQDLHQYRYLPAERIYISEVAPQGLADVVIDNSEFERPRIVRLS